MRSALLPKLDPAADPPPPPLACARSTGKLASTASVTTNDATSIDVLKIMDEFCRLFQKFRYEPPNCCRLDARWLHDCFRHTLSMSARITFFPELDLLRGLRCYGTGGTISNGALTG